MNFLVDFEAKVPRCKNIEPLLSFLVPLNGNSGFWIKFKTRFRLYTDLECTYLECVLVFKEYKASILVFPQKYKMLETNWKIEC